MTSRHRPRRGHVLAVALAVAAGPVAVPSSAMASPDCTTVSGVLVVVDLGDGRVRTGCAPGDPASGLDALVQAGFGVSYNTSGMVCRIAGHPGQCPASPPFDAYWSYWHGVASGGWRYATVGAGQHDPAPGSVEGWRFGGSGQVAPAHPGTVPAPPPPPPSPSASPSPSPAAPTPAPTIPPTTPPTTPSASSARSVQAGGAAPGASTPRAAGPTTAPAPGGTTAPASPTRAGGTAQGIAASTSPETRAAAGTDTSSASGRPTGASAAGPADAGDGSDATGAGETAVAGVPAGGGWGSAVGPLVGGLALAGVAFALGMGWWRRRA